LIATAGSNGVVRIYDWRNQRVIADLGHGERVSEIEFSPDGNLILTGSLDGTARVWDWEAERSVLELPDHPSWVMGTAFTAGGKMIVTGGEDGTARIFACAVCGSLADLQALVPERVTRGLTAEERARYVP
jgi:WD40 repeat protein